MVPTTLAVGVFEGVVLTGGPTPPPTPGSPFGGVGGAVGIVGASCPLVACIMEASTAKRANKMTTTAKTELHSYMKKTNYLQYLHFIINDC